MTTCPSFRSGTSFTDELFNSTFPKTVKVVLALKDKNFSVQATGTQNSEGKNICVTLKHKSISGGPLSFDIAGTKEKVALCLKCPDYGLTEAKVSHNAANIVRFSYSLTKAFQSRRVVFTQTGSFSGNTEEKKKRTMALKLDVKNENMNGNITSTVDWSVPENASLFVQSSICSNAYSPFQFGVSSSSRFTRREKEEGEDAKCYAINSAITTYVNYKKESSVTAILWNPTKGQATFYYLQKQFAENMRLGCKMQVNKIFSRNGAVASWGAVLKYSLGRGDYMGFRLLNDGSISGSYFLKHAKNTAFSCTLTHNFLTNHFFWGVSVKYTV